MPPPDAVGGPWSPLRRRVRRHTALGAVAFRATAEAAGTTRASPPKPGLCQTREGTRFRSAENPPAGTRPAVDFSPTEGDSDGPKLRRAVSGPSPSSAQVRGPHVHAQVRGPHVLAQVRGPHVLAQVQKEPRVPATVRRPRGPARVWAARSCAGPRTARPCTVEDVRHIGEAEHELHDDCQVRRTRVPRAAKQIGLRCRRRAARVSS